MDSLREYFFAGSGETGQQYGHVVNSRALGKFDASLKCGVLSY